MRTFKRFKTVKLVQGCETGILRGNMLHASLGGYDHMGIELPVISYCYAESCGSDEPPKPSICEIDEDTAKALAAELAEEIERTPKYGQEGWHPVFMPAEVMKVKGKCYAKRDEFIKAFR